MEAGDSTVATPATPSHPIAPLAPPGLAGASPEPTLDLRAGLPVGELEARLVAVSRAGDLGARALAFYLADMAERGLYQELGFPTVLRFAEVRLGLPVSTAREYLAAGRALDELPALCGAFRDGRLSWSQVRVLARIATPETEGAWATWAERHTVRQIERQAALREKGQLPTDPARRRIHATKLGVVGKLDLVEHELWKNALAKLAAETGAPATDRDLMLQAARLYLDLQPDGSVPGFARIGTSPFRVVVQFDARSGATAMQTAEGSVPLEAETARAVLASAGRADLAEGVSEPAGDENCGAPVEEGERDVPTPAELRERILLRDGCACLACGGKRNLTVHHRIWRRFGGRTVPENLLTLCEDCHSLVHARLLVVKGEAPQGLRFFDRGGREVAACTQPAGAVGEVASAGGPGAEATEFRDGEAARGAGNARALPEATVGDRRMRFSDLPDEAGPDWWRRHAHLFAWKAGELVFEPGQAREAAPLQAPAAALPSLGPASEGNVRAWRPRALDEVIGQQRVVASLRVAVAAAGKREAPLPHVLLSGPAGVGKTSLARAVANDLGTGFHGVHAPMIDEPRALLRLLLSLGDRDVVFVDEIHALTARIAECLYEAMEDGCITLPVRCESLERSLRLRLPRFTLIGATTEEERLPAPMRQRFEIRERLEMYDLRELVDVLERQATRLGLELDARASRILAGASRATPREALGLLAAARDEAVIAGASSIDAAMAMRALARRGLDMDGLLPFEREYLRILREAKRPLGLATLAAKLGATRQALQTVHEPYLLRVGLVRLTPFGRVAA